MTLNLLLEVMVANIEVLHYFRRPGRPGKRNGTGYWVERSDTGAIFSWDANFLCSMGGTFHSVLRDKNEVITFDQIHLATYDI